MRAGRILIVATFAFLMLQSCVEKQNQTVDCWEDAPQIYRRYASTQQDGWFAGKAYATCMLEATIQKVKQRERLIGLKVELFDDTKDTVLLSAPELESLLKGANWKPVITTVVGVEQTGKPSNIGFYTTWGGGDILESNQPYLIHFLTAKDDHVKSEMDMVGKFGSLAHSDFFFVEELPAGTDLETMAYKVPGIRPSGKLIVEGPYLAESARIKFGDFLEKFRFQPFMPDEVENLNALLHLSGQDSLSRATITEWAATRKALSELIANLDITRLSFQTSEGIPYFATLRCCNQEGNEDWIVFIQTHGQDWFSISPVLPMNQVVLEESDPPQTLIRLGMIETDPN